MSTVYELVREAVIEKLQVVAVYKGCTRQMCPHVLGWKRVAGRRGDGDSREAHALFYQFGGDSRSGLGPDGSPDNWRCIRVDQLRHVTLRRGPWHTAPNLVRPPTCVDEIDVAVSIMGAQRSHSREEPWPSR